ncbi:MAG: cbb3-type cytochrome c oxidase subunit 3 [Halothiobacillaceae bacterium]|nr:MAG: cbb3-type cytochrome c oxidase subunit 3 [Halothiobacillaceae bacterium]
MSEIWAWLGDLGNSKVLALLIFFTTFVGIVLYVYTGKQRKERLESYKNIPFIDDEDKNPASKHGDQ